MSFTSKPAWVVVAESLMAFGDGFSLLKDDETNPSLEELYSLCHVPYSLDRNSFAGAFVGASLALSGYESPSSTSPLSYRSFGRKLDYPIKGCLVLLNRMKSDHNHHGQIGFFDHIEGDKIFLLTGNEQNEIGLFPFPRSKIKSYHYPTKIALLPEPHPTSLPTIDMLTDNIPLHLVQEEEAVSDNPIQWRGELGDFDYCVTKIIEVSGGAQINPKSKAKSKKFGLSFDFLNQIQENFTLQELEVLTKTQASEIYKKAYWLPLAADNLPKPLALLTFNAATSYGFAPTVLLLQQTLNKQGSGLVLDGDMGSKTLAAALRVDMKQAIHDFSALERNYCENHAPKSETKAVLNKLAIFEQFALIELYDEPHMMAAEPVKSDTILEKEIEMTTSLNLTPSELQAIIANAVSEAMKLQATSVEKQTEFVERIIEKPMLVQERRPTLVEQLQQATSHAPVTPKLEVVRASQPTDLHSAIKDVMADMRAKEEGVKTTVVKEIKETVQEVVKPVEVTVPKPVIVTEPATQSTLSSLILTPIDKVLGGSLLAGKKTLLAVGIVVLNEILALYNIIPRTGEAYKTINLLAMGLGSAGILSKVDRWIGGKK